MWKGSQVLAYAIVPAAICVHIFLAPYTKVEESFNVQATHDIMYHSFHLEKYDHQEFPGVVPRSFIGAAATSLVAIPFTFIASLLGMPKIVSQYIVRMALGMMTSFSLTKVQQAVAKKFGWRVGVCFGLLLVSQFHLLFYASRFLPNTYAVIASNLALASLISEDSMMDVILYLCFGAAVFRCDLVLLIIPVALAMLLSRKVGLNQLVVAGFSFTVLSVLFTTLVDSLFWGRFLWPELEVFLFNNPVENRSAQWGVASPHWYFTSALPKCLSGSMIFIFFGLLYERRVRILGGVAVVYILLYSLLPHKEARFIFPVLPYLNVVAASGLDRIWKMKGGFLKHFGKLASVLVIAMSFLHVYVSSVASSLNYPGGLALKELHVLGMEDKNKNLGVHIDVLPAMTGASRFGEIYDSWNYSKLEWNSSRSEERLYLRELSKFGYRYLLSGAPDVPGYQLVKEIHGFSGISLPRNFEDFKMALLDKGVPLRFKSSPQVYIHKLQA